MALNENGNTHPRARPPFKCNASFEVGNAVARLFNSPSYFRSLAPSGSTCSFFCPLEHSNGRSPPESSLLPSPARPSLPGISSVVEPGTWMIP